MRFCRRFFTINKIFNFCGSSRWNVWKSKLAGSWQFGAPEVLAVPHGGCPGAARLDAVRAVAAYSGMWRYALWCGLKDVRRLFFGNAVFLRLRVVSAMCGLKDCFLRRQCRMAMRDIVSAFPLYVCVLLNQADFFKPSLSAKFFEKFFQYTAKIAVRRRSRFFSKKYFGFAREGQNLRRNSGVCAGREEFRPVGV